MLNLNLKVKELVRLMLTATIQDDKIIPGGVDEAKVDEYIRSLEGELGGKPVEPTDAPQEIRGGTEQLKAFAQFFSNNLNEMRIISINHFFVLEETFYVAILVLEPGEAQKVLDWYDNLFRPTQDGP